MPVLTHAAAGSIHDRKSAQGEAKVLDAAQGIVEAIVSVTGVRDDVNDIIVPGAYARTLAARVPKGVWSHDWDTPVSKTLMAEELMPGDPRLPAKLQAMGAGGLLVRTQFNLKTQRGRDAFADVEFFADESEWSIGYVVPPGAAHVDQKTGIRMIEDVDLFEYSPVLFGANPHTVTMSVKSAIGGHGTPVSNAAWDGTAARKALPATVEALRSAHAWSDTDEAGYAFLHHEVDEKGIVGAANVEPCLLFVKTLAEGPMVGLSDPDRRGIYEHLVGHLIDAGVEDIPVLAEMAAAKAAPKGVCAEHFTIEIAGVKSNTGHCEKTKDHEGPHGFDHREEEVGTKDSAVTPDGQEVEVEKAPNETETPEAEKLTEGLNETIEAEADAKDEKAAAASTETKDGDQPATVEVNVETANETPAVNEGGESAASEGEVEAAQGEGQEEKDADEGKAKTEEDPEKEIISAMRQIAELAGSVAERLASAWSDEAEEKDDAETADEEKTAAAAEAKQADPESAHVFREGVSVGRIGNCEICGKPKDANIHVTGSQGDDFGISDDMSRAREGNPDGISDSIRDALDGDPVGMETDMGRVNDGNPQGVSSTDDLRRVRRPVAGVTAQDDITRARTGRSEGPSTNLGEVRSLDAPVEVKIEAPLTGSFEDLYAQISTLVSSNPPKKNEGAETMAWIEGTFGDTVVVAVAEYTVGEADEFGFADVQMLGTHFYSLPYSTEEGVVTLGEPTPVEPHVVLTPKTVEVFADREVKAIQTKVGRTLSAANAEKIRASVLGLIEVLAAAGINLDEDDDDEKEAPADTETKGVALSALDLMKAQQLSLKAHL